MPTAEKAATDKVLNYIETLPEWSKNICTKLRSIILEADPAITEEWKWGPHYSSKGMVCGYGAFQKHIKFTFFNGSAMNDPENLFNHCVDNEFSRSIKYITESEIDAAILTQYIRQSIAVNQKGFKRQVKDKAIIVPEDLAAAMAEDGTAQEFFDNLSYVYKKDFVELVTTAKRAETRQQRIAKVVAHCTEKRRLNDKYKK